uniref:DUF4781 domain-containing protein n=1 Tax=Glossina brevipalpis TaxID=37001 RepID=A0A1A9WDG7_9MUSC
MSQRKTIRDLQNDFASYLGLDDIIVWDFYSAEQSDMLKKKIKVILPDQPKGQHIIEKMRSDLFQNVWNQRKYSKGSLYSSIFYVAVTSQERAISATEFSVHPVFRIRKCVVEGDSRNCCMTYVDEIGRVYQNWKSYIDENVLPPGTMVVPHLGVYSYRNREVLLDICTTPNGQLGATVMRQAQTAGSCLGLGAAIVPIAALAFPIAAPVMAAASVVGVAVGTMSAIASAGNLIDRSNHEQSTDITDRDARGSWLGLAGGVVGATSIGATKYMKNLATAGKTTTGVEILINSVNITSVVLSGSGVATGILDLIVKYQDGDDTSALDVLQVSASLVLFTHSVYNFQMASTIVDNVRNGHINEYQRSLSNRQRKAFNKMSKETIRLRGTQGKIDIIRNINDIPDRQYLNDLFKINKQLNQNKVRPAFASEGKGIVLNNEVTVETRTLRQSVQHQKGPNVLKSVTKPIPKTPSTAAKVNFSANPHNLIPKFDPFILLAPMFHQNIFNTKEWNNLVDFITTKLPEKIYRFVMKLTEAFIKGLHEYCENILREDTSTESFVFRILKYLYNKNPKFLDYDYFLSKHEEISKYLFEHIKWSRKIHSTTRDSFTTVNPVENFPDSIIIEQNGEKIFFKGSLALSELNENFPVSFIVAENNAKISIKDFGLGFLINIVDRNALNRITHFLCSNFPEKIVRFLLKLTERFLRNSRARLTVELRIIVTTESILFRIFKYWYTTFNVDIEKDQHKVDEIITNISRYFMKGKGRDSSVNDIPDEQNLEQLLKYKKQLKPNTTWTSLNRNEILLNTELHVDTAHPQNSSNVFQSVRQSVPENVSTVEDHDDDVENRNGFIVAENGAIISLNEFGKAFEDHIIESSALKVLIDYLCLHLSEETVRFLLRLTKDFIKDFARRIEAETENILNTESILFCIFKHCYDNYKENLNFEFLRDKRDEIIKITYKTFMPMTRIDYRKIKCKNCVGFYCISNIK